MQFKKTLLSSFVLLAATAQATELDMNQYSVSNLPTEGNYDGFIVYLKDDAVASASNARTSDLKNAISTSNSIEITDALSTGGLVVKSVADLGIFKSSEEGKAYKAKEDAKVFEELRAHPSVALVEPNLIATHQMNPNDSDYDKLWGLSDVNAGINVEAVWDTYTGKGVNVAVVDTGIVSHSDLNSNVRGGYDFVSDSWRANDGSGRDSNPADAGDFTAANECGRGSRASNSSWHGSHVAGTIAMQGNNYRGGIGVAHDATIVPVRVLGKCGGSSADIADAIVWASGGHVDGVPANQNPAKIINMSLGGRGSCSYTYQRAIDKAVANGAAVVVAAGNSNMDASNFAPASCNNVITVAALGAQGNRAGYSNYGSKIDVAAPGGDRQAGGQQNSIYSTVDRGSRSPQGEGYAYYDGTSMASPHVAGVAALLLEKEPNLSPAQIKQRLVSGVRNIPGTCHVGCGSGIVDVAKVLNVAGGPVDPDPIDPNPVGKVLKKGVAENISNLARRSKVKYTFNVPSNAKNLTFKVSGGSGDVDVFAKHSSSRTNDCSSERYGNNENCSVASPKSGKYTVELLAYKSSANFSIVANYEGGSVDENPNPTPGDIVLTDYVYSGQVVTTDGFAVPTGKLEGELSYVNSRADLDLFLQKKSSYSNTWYTVSTSRKAAGKTESIKYSVYTAGNYRWAIKSNRGSTNATLSFGMK